MAQYDHPKYMRTIMNYNVDYGEEDEDGLEDDNDGYFVSIAVNMISTKKPTSKDHRHARPEVVWQFMSLDYQIACNKVSDNTKSA
jgi:hypothetical protein